MARNSFIVRMFRHRYGRSSLLGAVAVASLLLAQRALSSPVDVLEERGRGPSLYLNTYVPGTTFANTVLWFGARHSAAAAHATRYVEERSPREIARRIHATAAEAGRPLTRITIAGHGKPGGVLLDRQRESAPESEWLLASHTLTDWLERDVASSVARDAVVVFESCDTSLLVQGRPAAEATAFRRALAATFDVPLEHVVLFRGPGKYAWTLDGWVPRTRPLEIVFGRDIPEAPAA